MSELSPRIRGTPLRPFGALTSASALGSPPMWSRAPRTALPESDRVSVREIRAMLRRQWVLILTVCALMSGLAALVLFRQLPRYRGAALLRVTDVRRAVTSGIEDP